MDVMKELGRWYHVKVVFENKNCLQTQVHFVAERKLSLEEVVRQLNELEVPFQYIFMLFWLLLKMHIHY